MSKRSNQRRSSPNSHSHSNNSHPMQNKQRWNSVIDPPPSYQSHHRSSNQQLNQQLKIVLTSQQQPHDIQELSLHDTRITIGRLKSSSILLIDPLVSGLHCEIINCVLSDCNSTNGTLYNNRVLKAGEKKLLKAGDRIVCGETELHIERGPVNQLQNCQDFNRSKRFEAGLFNSPSAVVLDEVEGRMENKQQKEGDESVSALNEAEARMTVDQLMDHEFARIIGHENIKKQLKQFNKKVQLDAIRAKAGTSNSQQDKKRLYHMIFQGPPGTGKTTMANVVSKIMLKMKLVQNDKVVFVNNALDLLGHFVGQTPAKVDAKVKEAEGGILFIDEAYSIIKEGGGRDGGQGTSFGREAIDTLMKHLDPPSCVMIFAGYEKPMEDFLKVNEGLSRRIPYRYTFETYTHEQLLQILAVMCKSKGETLEEGILPKVSERLESLPISLLEHHNAGLINNWISFAQVERDSRIDLEEAEANPELASLLTWEDLELALEKLKQMETAARSN